MSLQFYIGRAGSGKTWRCREEIAQRLREDPSPRSPSLIWLLPEQASAQSERFLLETPGLEGFARAHVLSFKRLAHYIMLEQGKPAHPQLDEMGRLMLLRAMVCRHSDELKVFSRSARENGFISRLSSTFTELAQFRHSLGDLESRFRELTETGQGESLLAMKMHDLALLGRAWESEVANRFSDSDHFLDNLATAIETTSFLSSAEVWLDGFSSFMPQEMRVIEAILKRASQVRVTLLMDPDRIAVLPANPDELDPTRLFSQTEETYLRLQGLALDQGIQVLDTLFFPEKDQITRFIAGGALQSLEEGLVESGLVSGRGSGANDETIPMGVPAELPSLIAVEAAGRREEVEAVARSIRRLCREGRNRYRDIAVVVRGLDEYHALIRSIFESHAIPFFIDKRRTVSHHPLVELIRSALRVVNDEWQFDDVSHYLKTDFPPVSRYDADAIENYALGHGVRGRRWWTEQPWPNPPRLYQEPEDKVETDKPRPDAIQHLERIRKTAFAPLLAFDTSMNAAKDETGITGFDFARTIIDFLSALDCPGKMGKWAEAAREATGEVGGLDAAAEHEQAWDGVTGLIAQVNEIIGQECLPLEDWISIVEAGLANLTLGLVPPSLDQVLVGSVDRSRQPALKSVFVLGMNEKLFPRIGGEDVIFSDSERKLLADKYDFGLSPVSSIKLFRECYLAYVALTRGSQFLWVSWAAADESGGALQASPFVHALASIMRKGQFDALHTRVDSAWLEGNLAALEKPSQAIETLIRLRSGDEIIVAKENRGEWAALEGESQKAPELQARLARAKQSHRSLPTQLSDSLAEFFGIATSFTISRLQTFAQCPFQYFSKYTLKLKEREQFRIEPCGIGQFHHDVLKEVYDILSERFGEALEWLPKEMVRRGLDWGKAPKDEAIKALEIALESNALKLIEDGLAEHQAAFMVERARRILRRSLSAFINQGLEDSFMQVAAEIKFGSNEAEIPPLRIEMADGKQIAINGQIDRLDIAPNGKQLCVRVIDYKSSEQRLHLEDMLAGLSLQLPIYLSAISNSAKKHIKPAGAFYLPIRQRFQTAPAPPDDADADAIDTVKAYGVVDCENLELFGPLEPGCTSPWIYVSRKKDTSLGVRGDWVPAGCLDLLCANACAEAGDLAEEISLGTIRILPCRKGGATSCALCDSPDVCRIAPSHRDFRDIPKRSKQEIIDQLQETLHE